MMRKPCLPAFSRSETNAWTRYAANDTGAPAAVVAGNDARGILVGVGRLLRNLRVGRDSIQLPSAYAIVSSPHSPLRGH